MRPSGNIPSESSPIDSLELPLAITLGSTLVEPVSAYSFVIPHDVTHVILSPHDDDSGSSTTSGDPTSSSLPVFHSDEDIMEAMTNPDFPWDDMHHHAHFLPQQFHDQYVVETKYFIPNEVDWFKNPILRLMLSKKEIWPISLLPLK